MNHGPLAYGFMLMILGVAAIFVGCSEEQPATNFPKVDHAAEVASTLKAQIKVLYTLSRQNPQNAKVLVDATLQSIDGLDETKSGTYWNDIQEIKASLSQLKSMYEQKASGAQIKKHIETLAKTAQKLPDTMLPTGNK